MSDDIDTREPVNVELELRREWWLHHGHDYALYGDDGEMQCSTCPADFKRMPLDVLQRYVFDARMKRAALAAAGVSGSPDETRVTLSYVQELEQRLRMACEPCAECGHIDYRELDDILDREGVTRYTDWPDTEYAKNHPLAGVGVPPDAERSSGSDDYEPYVVSDERLAEIRALFTERDEFDSWDLRAAPGVSTTDLVGAVYDLLGERDDPRVARNPEVPAGAGEARPAEPPDVGSPCAKCVGVGLVAGARDEWGFGVPCPGCNGTGLVSAAREQEA